MRLPGWMALAASWTAVSAADPWPLHVIDDSSSGADGVRLGDLNRDGRPDVVTGWEEGGITRVCLNPGAGMADARWPAVTVARTPHVEDALPADLDGDGAPDVVACCEGKTRAIFVHWGPKEPARVPDPEAWSGGVLPASRGRMMWMFATPVQLDGRHGPDLVAAGKGTGAGVEWFAAPADRRRLDRYACHRIAPVGWVMSIRTPDMDADGDPDVLVSDRRGPDAGVRWLENPGPGPAQSGPWTSHRVSRGDAPGTNFMFLDTGDLDGDGLQDVVYAAYARDSSLGLVRRLDRSGQRWRTRVLSLASRGMGRAKAVRLGDLDGDGDLDAAVSCETAGGKHGVAWFAADGDPFDGPWTMHPVSGTETGIKFDRIELLDLDGDGDLDLLTCEENEGPHNRGLGVVWYENPAR